jgi:hypothetical protein
MADALLPGVRCDVDGRRHPLACLGCRELNYGQHSTLPLHRFRLSMPETALAGHRARATGAMSRRRATARISPSMKCSKSLLPMARPCSQGRATMAST